MYFIKNVKRAIKVKTIMANPKIEVTYQKLREICKDRVTRDAILIRYKYLMDEVI